LGGALWVVHAHAIDAFDYSPGLALVSAEKQSGKTRCLEVIATMARLPIQTESIQPGCSIQGVIEAEQPTVLMDEADPRFPGG
jgi:hypothetical protein